jgi:hypothetical protein
VARLVVGGGQYVGPPVPEALRLVVHGFCAGSASYAAVSAPSTRAQMVILRSWLSRAVSEYLKYWPGR